MTSTTIPGLVTAADPGVTLDVEVHNVRKVYPNGVVGLHDVSLSIPRGSFFSLLGPSGCGKSTLLRILSGLETPTAGTVSVRGQDVTGVPSHRRPTNLVFQRLALFPHLTVAQNVAFGPSVNGKPSAEVTRTVAEMLELVGLETYGDRLPSQLSGGQQQRVAIARALANRPTVLLLDEPLSALDLKLRTQMQHSLKQIQRDSGTTFVYVTHDQGEAFTMSDTIAVMNEGRIQQIGSPVEVYERPTTLFSATFLGETNILSSPKRGTRISARGLDISLPEEGSLVSIRPEHVEIGASLGADIDNRFPGRVTDITFRGSILRYAITAGDGVELISERSSSVGFHPTVGDALQVGWRTDSSVVLDDPTP
jgi:ABC-type Fe3+/spermidine/putrescine transport system ATPase subunit